MTDMFGGVRWRMVGWSILVLSVILAATGAVLYVSLNRTLMSSVDAQLQSASASAEVELEESSGITDLQREGYQSGLLYLIIASDGNVVANPQGIDVENVPPDLLSGRSQAFETVAIEGTAVRLFAQQIPMPGGGDALTLVVGMPLAPVQAGAHDLLLTLLLCGAVGLALSFLGAWFLAARALVPVQGAFERQQEFVADASHELRTPLTILHSTADLLAREPQPDAKLVLEMREEIVRMERLTRDLLTLARSDRGELHLSVGRLELGALARDLAHRVGLLAEARGSKVELSVPDAPVRVEADPDRLQEVGLILLDNALRHTPAGGTISITVAQRPGSGLLVVEDTGEGIPEEHLTRVFERFHRVDPSRDRRSGGAGLGLAIADTIIAAHGGTISITRRPEGGTRVAIRLPLLMADGDLDEASRSSLSGDLATR